ncbi:putative GABA permease [Rhodocollybia butyracea]|uniref:GABA permease n=1 Tax=Rhodocollybia butyracea TaxID=206335 RepID=A0A9P5UCE2_9AGAR|nr:putative GABA permease [Rhodocollybia butyracea]
MQSNNEDIGVVRVSELDRKDMFRMGKHQEFKRNFRLLSTYSFATMIQAAWEFLLMKKTLFLMFFGVGFIVLSLAEMASMAPTSGGQYHWVSEFAPPEYQKFLSYLSGWMSTLSWQAGVASGAFLLGTRTIIQALIVINQPDYTAEGWKGTLLVFAIILIVYVVNVWAWKFIAPIQNLFLFLHVAGFIIIIVVLWTLAPHQSAHVVFTEFTSRSGWSNIGVSLMVGQITAMFCLLCSDGTAHMAEEVQDAGRHVPIAMVWAYIGNGVLGVIFYTTYLFAVVSVDDALDDPSGFPFIYVLRNTLSLRGVNALTSIILLPILASNISFTAATSRQTWAFARDHGPPCSNWISKVSDSKQIPSNSVALTCVITILLSLINIGSTVAFNVIISLQVAALMFSYGISISCILHRRLVHPELLPPAQWNLGRWGVLINAIGIAYVVFGFFWSFWPNSIPIDPMNFNWSVVIFLGVLLFCLVMYMVEGRKVYHGPVVIVIVQEK